VAVPYLCWTVVYFCWLLPHEHYASLGPALANFALMVPAGY